MSDTGAQHRVEEWICGNYLRRKYKKRFDKKKLKLKWGGEFEFDAVSDDGSIVANISTSSAITEGGKVAIGKIQKIRSDTLFLLHTLRANRKLLVFTEKDMKDCFERMRKKGRFPGEEDIELVLCDNLPAGIRKSLGLSKERSSNEVSPRRRQ